MIESERATHFTQYPAAVAKAKALPLALSKRDPPPPPPGPRVAKRPRGGRAPPLQAVPQVDSRPGEPPQWAPWAGREDAKPEPAGRRN
jgi:hypothetical protein